MPTKWCVVAGAGLVALVCVACGGEERRDDVGGGDDTDDLPDAGDCQDSDSNYEAGEAPFCDCPDISGVGAVALASALNLCSSDPAFINAETHFSSSDGEQGYDSVSVAGCNDCLRHLHGCQMLALSTGPVGQDNPNYAQSMDGSTSASYDPVPAYDGYEVTDGVKKGSCDLTQLTVTLEVPADKNGFSFDFLFASAEYDEYVGQGYNDTFYAILVTPGLNGGASTNIAFDNNNNEIEVDSNYFENSDHLCDEFGSGWGPETPSESGSAGSGSTGWLRTSWPVPPGDSFNLTFSIHDEGDCIYDSIVFIDNFQWLDDATAGTVPIE